MCLSSIFGETYGVYKQHLNAPFFSPLARLETKTSGDSSVTCRASGSTRGRTRQSVSTLSVSRKQWPPTHTHTHTHNLCPPGSPVPAAGRSVGRCAPHMVLLRHISIALTAAVAALGSALFIALNFFYKRRIWSPQAEYCTIKEVRARALILLHHFISQLCNLKGRRWRHIHKSHITDRRRNPCRTLMKITEMRRRRRRMVVKMSWCFRKAAVVILIIFDGVYIWKQSMSDDDDDDDENIGEKIQQRKQW